MNRHLRNRTLLLVAIGCIAALASAADWPNWRGPQHDGISHESGWKPELSKKPRWTQEIGVGFSSFAVADGRVYTMGNVDNRDIVWCLDADTGELLWKHDYSEKRAPQSYEGGPSATPTLADGLVYTVSKSGKFYCLAADKGTVVWEKDLRKDIGAGRPKWGFAGSALVMDGRVYLNAGPAGACLDAKSGKVIWDSGKGKGGYATPVPFSANGEEALAIFAEVTLVAVRARDGRKLWEYPWKTAYEVNAADPIIHDGLCFISSGYNKGAALLDISGETPREIWTSREMRNHFNSCVLWEGHVYGFDEQTLKCLQLNDKGDVKWTYRGLGKGSLMIADGKLIVLGEKGELVIAPATPEHFEPITSREILERRCWTVPVLANGRIFARNASGKTVCYDLMQEK
jgi:outer membrane protein assembly factor BamB